MNGSGILQKKCEDETTQRRQNRETVIAARKGLYNPSIVSLNPDPITTHQTQQDIAQNLVRNKIHIDLAQETHIPQDRNYEKMDPE